MSNKKLGLYESWILYADMTNSTEFFSTMKEVINDHAQEFQMASASYCHQISEWFDLVELEIKSLPGAELVNTMGDAFLARGVQGHGTPHITSQADNLLAVAKKIKENGDRLLDGLRAEVQRFYIDHGISGIIFPSLAAKITVSQGYQVMDFTRNIYVGDTINHCCRVASQVFKGLNDCVVITDRFFDVLPELSQQKYQQYDKPIELQNYPKKNASSPVIFYALPLTAITSDGT